MSRELSPGTLAQLACILEVTARKPGNVHPEKFFSDLTHLDFLLSAAALGAAFDRSLDRGVGAIVLDTVESTRRVVATNTNLGMVLLLAPLAAVPPGRPLRDGVVDVLGATTVADARLVYQAIRLARPGGLGHVDAEDVGGEPSLPLVEVMRLAAARDAVARQYVSGFADVFDVGVRALRRALDAGQPLETAVIAAHLRLLADVPDTLIARKRGGAEAIEAARHAAAILDAGWPDGPESQGMLARLDDWLRGRGHERNPGTTADLVAAALFVALRDGTIKLPVPGGRDWWSSAGL
jgi:triphosphoribosyl-dephospho-CoA synthase